MPPPEAATPAAVNSAAGHRVRLRKRLLTGGAEALADYEVLEYLLFAANPRGELIIGSARGGCGWTNARHNSRRQGAGIKQNCGR